MADDEPAAAERDDLDYWEQRGEDAFASGDTLVSGMPAEVRREIDQEFGTQVGAPGALEAAKAWIRGWTRANVEAPMIAKKYDAFVPAHGRPDPRKMTDDDLLEQIDQDSEDDPRNFIITASWDDPLDDPDRGLIDEWRTAESADEAADELIEILTEEQQVLGEWRQPADLHSASISSVVESTDYGPATPELHREALLSIRRHPQLQRVYAGMAESSRRNRRAGAAGSAARRRGVRRLGGESYRLIGTSGGGFARNKPGAKAFARFTAKRMRAQGYSVRVIPLRNRHPRGSYPVWGVYVRDNQLREGWDHPQLYRSFGTEWGGS